jgi:hypothetical protein
MSRSERPTAHVLQQAAGKAVKSRTARAATIDAGTDPLSLLGSGDPFTELRTPGRAPPGRSAAGGMRYTATTR